MHSKIKALAKKYAPEFIEVRHHLHAHPELSYQEYETSKYVQQRLTDLGIPFEVKATTGVVGLIKGKNPDSRIIALRADMDALPIKEENDIPYKSKNEGVMHACGHDVHTTCLLGAAKILKELSQEWEGTVKLVFQPGEEKNPGGASLMIKDGGAVLNDFGFIGTVDNSTGTATVSGAGSTWSNGGFFGVGQGGNGTLTIEDGGSVSVKET